MALAAAVWMAGVFSAWVSFRRLWKETAWEIRRHISPVTVGSSYI